MALSATVYIYSTYALMALFAIAFILGKDQIINKLKHKMLNRAGWDYFAFFSNGGYVIEKVLKRKSDIKWNGGSYLYNNKQPFRYDRGGNMFMEGNAQPVNIGSLFKEASKPKLSNDPGLITPLLKRAYNLGKIKQQAFNKAEQNATYVMLGGFAIVGYLVYKQSEETSEILRLVRQVAGG